MPASPAYGWTSIGPCSHVMIGKTNQSAATATVNCPIDISFKINESINEMNKRPPLLPVSNSVCYTTKESSKFWHRKRIVAVRMRITFRCMCIQNVWTTINMKRLQQQSKQQQQQQQQHQQHERNLQNAIFY